MTARASPRRGRARPVRVVALLGALAAIAGCGGVRAVAVRDTPDPAADAPAPPPVAPPVPAPAEPAVPVAVAVEPAPLPVVPVAPRQVQEHVAQQMARHPLAVRRKVAETVLAESKRAGVDPLLVLAVIHVESSFRPRAVSRAGAVGLMQVRVPTLRQELGRPRARRSEAMKPAVNVQGGVRYLRRMLDVFGGTDLALMAYNAGPGRLQHLLASGHIPPAIREYADRVMNEVERLRDVLGLRPRRPAPVTVAKRDDE